MTSYTTTKVMIIKAILEQKNNIVRVGFAKISDELPDGAFSMYLYGLEDSENLRLNSLRFDGKRCVLHARYILNDRQDDSNDDDTTLAPTIYCVCLCAADDNWKLLCIIIIVSKLHSVTFACCYLYILAVAI